MVGCDTKTKTHRCIEIYKEIKEMAQNTPKTFEEYNFQEFLKAKEEVAGLKAEIKDMQEQMDILAKHHQDIIDLVKKALKYGRVDDDSYVNIYLADRFVGLYNKDAVEDNEQWLVALKVLIQLVNHLPTREE